jgi:hypothetical protein
MGQDLRQCLHGELNMVKTFSSHDEDTTAACEVDDGGTDCPQPSIIKAGRLACPATWLWPDPSPGVGIFSPTRQLGVKTLCAQQRFHVPSQAFSFLAETNLRAKRAGRRGACQSREEKQ